MERFFEHGYESDWFQQRRLREQIGGGLQDTLAASAGMAANRGSPALAERRHAPFVSPMVPTASALV